MQDYKLVIRAVTGGDTTAELQNVSEFHSWLNEMYLSQGYKVLSADFVEKFKGNEQGAPAYYEFAYHLVKEVAENVESTKDVKVVLPKSDK